MGGVPFYLNHLGFFQFIPYFHQQFFGAGGFSGCRSFFLFETLHGFDDQEENKSNNDEFYYSRKKEAVFDGPHSKLIQDPAR